MLIIGHPTVPASWPIGDMAKSVDASVEAIPVGASSGTLMCFNNPDSLVGSLGCARAEDRGGDHDAQADD